METRRQIMQPTVARKAADGGWWLMSRKAGGWASFGYPYNTLIEIGQDWAVTLGQGGIDEHGEYINVAPRAEGSSPVPRSR